MALSEWRAQEAELKRLARVKRSDANYASLLGPEMVEFFQHSVTKRQTKFSKLAECWSQLVPETLSEHCALESLNRGTLTVLVDSASHLYELKQLLLAGIQEQLVMACKFAGLKKIALKPGQFRDTADPAGRKLRSP